MMDIQQMAFTICEFTEADFDKFAATVPDGVRDDECRRYYKLGIDVGVMRTLMWLIDNGVLIGDKPRSQ